MGTIGALMAGLGLFNKIAGGNKGGYTPPKQGIRFGGQAGSAIIGEDEDDEQNPLMGKISTIGDFMSLISGLNNSGKQSAYTPHRINWRK
jgi:hypothetical protein